MSNSNPLSLSSSSLPICEKIPPRRARNTKNLSLNAQSLHCSILSEDGTLLDNTISDFASNSRFYPADADGSFTPMVSASFPRSSVVIPTPLAHDRGRSLDNGLNLGLKSLAESSYNTNLSDSTLATPTTTSFQSSVAVSSPTVAIISLPVQPLPQLAHPVSLPTKSTPISNLTSKPVFLENSMRSKLSTFDSLRSSTPSASPSSSPFYMPQIKRKTSSLSISIPVSASSSSTPTSNIDIALSTVLGTLDSPSDSLLSAKSSESTSSTRSVSPSQSTSNTSPSLNSTSPNEICEENNQYVRDDNNYNNHNESFKTVPVGSDNSNIANFNIANVATRTRLDPASQTNSLKTNMDHMNSYSQQSSYVNNNNPNNNILLGSLDPYPNGPVLVISPYVYLYSEPTLAIASQFDVVINVAKEVSPLYSSRAMADINIAPPTIKQPEYYHIQWTHTSTLLNDLPQLCDLLLWRTQARKRILVHCQCGVSRSASLLVAFIMREQSLGLNEAYKLIKGASPVIGPNMRLIFQLVDWGKWLKGELASSDDDEDRIGESDDHNEELKTDEREMLHESSRIDVAVNSNEIDEEIIRNAEVIDGDNVNYLY